jgi:hypothetical protein
MIRLLLLAMAASQAAAARGLLGKPIRALQVDCKVGPAADPSLVCGTPGQFCRLEVGVCNTEPAIRPGVCVETPDMCTMDMNPVW